MRGVEQSVACITACDEERNMGGVGIVVLGVEPGRIFEAWGGFEGRLSQAYGGVGVPDGEGRLGGCRETGS